jgi:hypothetical protein
MCRAFSRDTFVQARYLTGGPEKCFSRPPVMCLHEWQDSVQAHSRTTLASMMTEPRPNPKPPSGPSGDLRPRSCRRFRFLCHPQRPRCPVGYVTPVMAGPHANAGLTAGCRPLLTNL